MKKIILGTIFFAVSMLSYSEVKDNLALFKAEEITEIEKKIEELKGEQGVTLYVTSFPEGESFVPAALEKVMVINFNKEKEGTEVKVQLKFTPDLNMDDAEDEIGEILDGSAPLIETGKNAEYALNLIQGMEKILVEKSEINAEEEKAVQETAPEENTPEENIAEVITPEVQTPVLEETPSLEIVENIIEPEVPKTDYKKYVLGAMGFIIALGMMRIVINTRRIIKKNRAR